MILSGCEFQTTYENDSDWVSMPCSTQMQINVALSGSVFQSAYANENDWAGVSFSLHMQMRVALSGCASMAVAGDMDASESIYGGEKISK